MDGLGMQLERNVFVNSITNEFDDKILRNTVSKKVLIST